MDIEVIRIGGPVSMLLAIFFIVFFSNIPDVEASTDVVRNKLNQTSLFFLMFVSSVVFHIFLIIFDSGEYSFLNSQIPGLLWTLQILMIQLFYLELDLFVLRYKNADLIMGNNCMKDDIDYARPRLFIICWFLAFIAGTAMTLVLLWNMSIYGVVVFIAVMSVFMFKSIKEMFSLLVEKGSLEDI